MNNALVLLAQTAVPTESFFEGFSTDQRFGIVLALIGGAVFLAFIFACVWSEIREKQIEADLKRDMLDRGMTAEEIQDVIEAVPRSGFAHWMGSWCKRK